MNKYMILMLICTMFSAVSQILLKQSANEEHASALREYLNWRVIVAVSYTHLTLPTKA